MTHTMIGFLLTLLLPFVAMLVKDDFSARLLWDPTAFGVVIGGTLFYALAAHPPREAGNFFTISILGRCSPDEARRAQRYGETVQKVCFGLAGVFAILNLMALLARLDDPKNIGPRIAATFCGILYACILGGIVIAHLTHKARVLEDRADRMQ